MSFDITLLNAIHGLAGWSGTLDAAGIFLAQYFPYLLAIPFILFLLKRKTTKERMSVLLFSVLAMLLSRGILTEAIRLFFPRQRPFEAFGFTPLIPESGSSFPSGHAAFFFALSFAIFAVDKKWGWWFIGLSLLNGLARVFVGVHYPSDIAGGLLIGLVSYLVITYVFRIAPSSGKEGDAPHTRDEHADPQAV